MAKRKGRKGSSEADNRNTGEVDKKEIPVDNSEPDPQGTPGERSGDTDRIAEAQEIASKVDPETLELLKILLEPVGQRLNEQTEFNTKIMESMNEMAKRIDEVRLAGNAVIPQNTGGKSNWVVDIVKMLSNPSVLKAIFGGDEKPQVDDEMQGMYKGMFKAFVEAQKDSFNLDAQMKKARLERLRLENQEYEREASEGW